MKTYFVCIYDNIILKKMYKILPYNKIDNFNVLK